MINSGDKRYSKFDLVKHIKSIRPDWLICPGHAVSGAVFEAHKAFLDTLKAVDGKPATFRFRSRKENKKSITIVNSFIHEDGFYPRLLSGKMRSSAQFPRCRDARLVNDRGIWYLACPVKERAPRCENQAGRIVALDPGVRTFISFYSPVVSGKIGKGAFTRIFNILKVLDLIKSRMAKANNRRKKSLKKALDRLSRRVSNLIDDLHWKTARFLVDNFDVIVCPKFETQQMAEKVKRKINSKTVRSMLSLGHFRFKQRLQHLCYKMGKTLVLNTEEYTSKTHPDTGRVNDKLGSAKTIQLVDGSRADRDITGAFNFLLKTLLSASTHPELGGKLGKFVMSNFVQHKMEHDAKRVAKFLMDP